MVAEVFKDGVNNILLQEDSSKPDAENIAVLAMANIAEYIRGEWVLPGVQA